MNTDRYTDLLALSDDLDDQVSAARKAKSPDIEILLAARRAVNAEIAELGAKRYDARCAAYAAQKDAERVAAAEQTLRAALASCILRTGAGSFSCDADTTAVGFRAKVSRKVSMPK